MRERVIELSHSMWDLKIHSKVRTKGQKNNTMEELVHSTELFRGGNVEGRALGYLDKGRWIHC